MCVFVMLLVKFENNIRLNIELSFTNLTYAVQIHLFCYAEF